MIIDHEDSSLIRDYKETLQSEEKILWQGKLNAQNKFSLESLTDGSLLFEISLYGVPASIFLFFYQQFLIGSIIIILFILVWALFFYNKKSSKESRRLKLKYTEYLLTETHLIFIQWHDKKIHIHSLPINNIKKAHRSKTPGGLKSVFIIPKEKVDFQTYNYWNDVKNPYITLSNIYNSDEVLQLIRKRINS